MSSQDSITYFTVIGPGSRSLANFRLESDALEFKERVVNARLAQLDRIKDRLTSGELRGELNFRRNGIRIEQQTIEFMSQSESRDISDENLVDGRFLIPVGRRSI